MPLSEQQKYQLEHSWLGLPPVTEFWVGLTRAMDVRPISLAAASLGEPKAGYSRQRLQASELRWNGDILLAQARSFMNTGETTWPPVGALFVCTSRDNSGVLISYEEFDTFKETGDERVIMKNDVLDAPIRVRI